MMLKGAAAILLTVALALHPPNASAQVIADSVQFAGISFLAPDAEILTRFPVFSAVLKRAEASGQPLNRSLLAALREAGLPLSEGLAKNYGLTMSFAVDDEYRVVDTLVDRFDQARSPTVRSGYRVVTGITGQLLTYDIRENRQVAISAFPVIYEYQDVLTAPPGQSYTAEVAGAVLQDFIRRDASGVFPIAAGILRTMPPSKTSRCLVRVAPLSFDSMTRKAGRRRFGNAEERMAEAMRNLVQRYLVTSAQFPLLPNGDSKARSEMLQRFANGEVFRLEIPDPNFEIVVEDLRLRQMVAGQSSSRRIDATGIQAQVAVQVRSEVDSSERARGTFRYIVHDTVPVYQPPSDSWSQFTEALKGFTTSLGSAMRRKDKEWFKKNDVAASAFPALPNWLQSCAQ